MKDRSSEEIQSSIPASPFAIRRSSAFFAAPAHHGAGKGERPRRARIVMAQSLLPLDFKQRATSMRK
jgi:hypothetical protein